MNSNDWLMISAECLCFINLGYVLHRKRKVERELHEYWRAAENNPNPGAGPSAGYVANRSFSYYAANYPGTSLSTGNSSGVNVPVVRQDDPIRAWKHAYVEWHDGWWTFAGMTGNSYRYGADSTAICPYRLHAAPVLECSCGFYAFKEKPSALLVGREWLLRVELFGTVIEYEHGYRAERQRVLDVDLRAYCYYCGKSTETFVIEDPMERKGSSRIKSFCGNHLKNDAIIVSADDIISALQVGRYREVE